MNHAWVALLRGVNLAGRNRVSMPALRQALSAAGYEDVRTYIASGNVLLRAPERGRAALARRLEKVIRESSGVTSAVVLRTPSELARAVDAHPFGRDTSRSHVVFFAERPRAAAVREIAAADVAPDRIEIVGSEVYILRANTGGRSRVQQSLLDRLGIGTTRNFRTVTKLAELAAEL
jgi:uncharacterized protein (DUF1697 family)